MPKFIGKDGVTHFEREPESCPECGVEGDMMYYNSTDEWGTYLCESCQCIFSYNTETNDIEIHE